MALVRPGHCRELSVSTKIAGIGPETAEELRDIVKTISFLYYRYYRSRAVYLFMEAK